jgi:integrase
MYGDVKDISILVHDKGNKDRTVYISAVLKKILIKYERLRKQYFDVRFHNENSQKTCPGTSIVKYVFIAEVRSLGKKPIGAKEESVQILTGGLNADSVKIIAEYFIAKKWWGILECYPMVLVHQ